MYSTVYVQCMCTLYMCTYMYNNIIMFPLHCVCVCVLVCRLRVRMQWTGSYCPQSHLLAMELPPSVLVTIFFCSEVVSKTVSN